MASEHNAIAKALFAGIAPSYDRWAEVFSLLQYRHWRRALLSTLNPQRGEGILDLSTGTGAVAFDVASKGCHVVGLDISRAMLQEAQRRAGRLPHRLTVDFVEGRAEELPFRAASFDAVSFTFLLRYVADPTAQIQEIARVLRPGGRAVMLEFAVPDFAGTRALWQCYVSVLLPLVTLPVSKEWARVGTFLGGSIAEFYRRYPLPKLTEDWRHAGFDNVECQRLSAGGAVVVSGVKA